MALDRAAAKARCEAIASRSVTAEARLTFRDAAESDLPAALAEIDALEGQCNSAAGIIAMLRGDIAVGDEKLTKAEAELARVRALVPAMRSAALALGAVDEDALPATAAQCCVKVNKAQARIAEYHGDPPDPIDALFAEVRSRVDRLKVEHPWDVTSCRPYPPLRSAWEAAGEAMYPEREESEATRRDMAVLAAAWAALGALAIDRVLAEVAQEIARFQDDGFGDDAASAVGAMTGSAANASDARCGSAEERAAVLETVARGLVALRVLDEEKSR